MRKFLAIIICKLTKKICKYFGRGSSFPGQLALKICPDTFPPSLLSKALFELHRGTYTEKAGRMWGDMIRSSGLKFIEQLPPDLYVGYGAFCAEIAGIKDYKADIR